MQMSGERTIAAERAAVWAALNDADVLKECIPGCQEMTKTSPTEFEAKVTQKVGPVRANFTGEVELTDIVEGESYRISGKGKGGAAGGATGGAAVRLEEVTEGTKLAYNVDAKVTGKLAQLGSRLIDGFAKKMADDFFDRFKTQVEGPGAAGGGDGDAGAAGGDASDAAGTDQQGWQAAAGKLQGTIDGMNADTRRIRDQQQSDPRNSQAGGGGASGAADAGVMAASSDAPEPPAEQGHEVPRPGDGAAARSAMVPPVAGHGAGRAHDFAAGAAASGTQASVEGRGAKPAPQKKSWWARLFG